MAEGGWPLNLINFLLALLIIAAGAGAVAYFLSRRWWRSREESTLERVEALLTELKTGLTKLESQRRELMERYKKIKRFDQAQLDLVKQIVRSELSSESKKSVWISTILAFVVGLFFFLAGLFAQRLFN